jgi:hypothetical protein
MSHDLDLYSDLDLHSADLYSYLNLHYSELYSSKSSKHTNVFDILAIDLKPIDLSFFSPIRSYFQENVTKEIISFSIRSYFKKNITEELIKKVFHPNNIYKFKGWGFEGDEDNDE